MTRLITTVTIIVLAIIGKLNAQSVVGHWTGTLEISGMSLPINLHISEENEQLITTMDSPEQGAMGIATTSTSFTEGSLEVVMDEMMVNYTATLNEDELVGTFKQGNGSTPLTMKRVAEEGTTLKTRPQDPKKPYPYKVEEVRFENPAANNIKLTGTLTLPYDGEKFPAVVLISGSGPQNRNEEIFNHRPFLVLADHLTRNGIAVLRYDDRGVAESEGTQKGATSADFATDVEAAVAYLRTRTDIDHKKIGLAGHSEGGFIAPMVASRDKQIGFIALLSGTGVQGDKILTSQMRRSNELAGAPKEALDFNDDLLDNIFKLVKTDKDSGKLEENIKSYLTSRRDNGPKNLLTASLSDDVINENAKTFNDPWMVYFIQTDPAQFLNKVDCPVLAINGEKDFQVIPKLNLPAIEAALKTAGNNDVTIKELEGLNHLFQTSTTGAGTEYKNIEETFSPKALTLVSEWILAKTK